MGLVIGIADEGTEVQSGSEARLRSLRQSVVELGCQARWCDLETAFLKEKQSAVFGGGDRESEVSCHKSAGK